MVTPCPTPAPSLRPAGPADLPGLVSLTNLAYRVESAFLQGPRTTPEDVTQLMDKGTFLLLPGTADGMPPRGSVYLETQGDRGYLGLLAVDPACQGQGLAKVLVAAVEAACRKAGCRFLDLTVVNLRRDLFDFYAKLGFAPFGTLPFPRPAKVLQPCHLIQYTKPLLPVGDL